MKKFIYTIILLITFLGSTAYAAELPDFPFILADGRAEISVEPNIATVSFRVEQFDEDEIKALELVQNRCSELLDFFMALKIEKDDIVGYEIDKRAVREKSNYSELKILGYEVSRRFSVKLRDLSLYEKFIKKLLTLKNVVDIDTKFDRTDRKKIEADLLAQSSRDAKEQAGLMAKGFGVKLGSVFAISQEGFDNIATVFTAKRYVASALAGAIYANKGELLFVPATITIKNEVTAIFRIEDD